MGNTGYVISPEETSGGCYALVLEVSIGCVYPASIPDSKSEPKRNLCSVIIYFHAGFALSTNNDATQHRQRPILRFSCLLSEATGRLAMRSIPQRTGAELPRGGLLGNWASEVMYSRKLVSALEA